MTGEEQGVQQAPVQPAETADAVESSAEGLEQAVEQGASEVLGAAEMRTGLGVDIVSIARMEKILGRSPAFRTRVFTEDERVYCDAHHKPHLRYATHFAAKEAVLKALGTGFSQGIRFTDVEVAHNGHGRPVAVLHGKAEQIAQGLGVVEIPLSLSRTADTAVANAIAVTEASKPVSDEKESPRQQLANRFKELRGMLDQMDAPDEAQIAGEPQEGAEAELSADEGGARE